MTNRYYKEESDWNKFHNALLVMMLIIGQWSVFGMIFSFIMGKSPERKHRFMVWIRILVVGILTAGILWLFRNSLPLFLAMSALVLFLVCPLLCVVVLYFQDVFDRWYKRLEKRKSVP